MTSYHISNLLKLEKEGQFHEALQVINRLRQAGGSPGPGSIPSLNLELLEARLRLRTNTSPPGNVHTSASPLKPGNRPPPRWSAIITMWKRSDYFEEQISAILEQSIPPAEVIVVLNERHIPDEFFTNRWRDKVKLIRSEINSLYSRWALAYVAEGDYVCVFDDDVIPGQYWIANAIRACERYGALVGPSGRIYNMHGKHGYFDLVVPGASPADHQAVDASECDTFCDWVCNSYLFKREWVGHALSQPRHLNSSKTFDDIQLATSLFLGSGIRCVTPMQPAQDKSLHGSTKHQYGNDSHAIWKTNSDQHFKSRKEYLEKLIGEGYVPVRERNELHRFHLIVPFGDSSALERCLLSVKGQDYGNYTCTVIDDSGQQDTCVPLLIKLGLDPSRFRYIKGTQKLHPLRSREIATDLLDADPADVVVHLDGDDWLPYPDVLSRLNRAYRLGGINATYGNTVSYRGGHPLDPKSFTPYSMSCKWNIAQDRKDAPVFPFRRVTQEEAAKGWGSAPWCGMHMRTYTHAKWLSHPRTTFKDSTGRYLQVATDAAILIPILNNSKFDSVLFLPELTYIYQNANNTIHAGASISPETKERALRTVSEGDMTPDYRRLTEHLKGAASVPSVVDAQVTFGDLPFKRHMVSSRSLIDAQSASHSNQAHTVMTVVTPEYLADAIICLSTYRANINVACDAHVFLCCTDRALCDQIDQLLADLNISAIFPHSLKHTQSQSTALSAKYSSTSDEYRWAMKGVVLTELLGRGYGFALFLDPDTYTVSDVSDIHSEIAHHSISVFPHFRDPDHDYLRKVLYKDGFFNGGMLGASAHGLPHLQKLYARCLNEMSKDQARSRWDDQKYFDLFALEVPNLYVNRDRGIDYNPWNYEPVEGMLAPSQRSYMLKSGFYVRHWHVSSTMVKNSIEITEEKFAVYRPVVFFYLTTLLVTHAFLALALRRRPKGLGLLEKLGLLERMRSTASKLDRLGIDETSRSLHALCVATADAEQTDVMVSLSRLVPILSQSSMFDNFHYFAEVIDGLFKDENARSFATDLRNKDLRFITDAKVLGPHLRKRKSDANFSSCDAGAITAARLQALSALIQSLDQGASAVRANRKA